MDQYKQDYMSFMNNRTKEVIRKSKSKLGELNTFKIGNENREYKRKNYQEVTDNLVLNPTNSKNVILNDMNVVRNNIARGQGNNYNIISNAYNNQQYGEHMKNYTSKEYRHVNNNDNYDKFGRVISNQDTPKQGLPQDTPKPIEGIEHLENYFAVNDHYNYRPPSGNRGNHERNPQTNDQGNPYGQDTRESNIYGSDPYPQNYYPKQGYPENVNQQESYNQYNNVSGTRNESYLPNEQYNYNNQELQQNDPNNYGNQQMNYKQNQEYPQYQQEPQMSKPQQTPPQSIPMKGKKVDLESLPIPDNVKTVEDYEVYLRSLGVDPYTLEYVGSQVNQEMENNIEKMQRMNLGNDHQNPNANPQVDYSSQQNSNYPQHQEGQYPNSNKTVNQQEMNQYKRDYGFNNPSSETPKVNSNQSNQMNMQYQAEGQQYNHVNTQPTQVNSKEVYGSTYKASYNGDHKIDLAQQGYNNAYEKMISHSRFKPYRNQSQIVIGDASLYDRRPNTHQTGNRSYSPLVKNQPIMVNPCKGFLF